MSATTSEEKRQRPLTPKQARFVQEYLVDLNATQAAIRTGYSASTAYSIGHELLKKPEIEEAVANAQKDLAQRVEINQEWVLRRLKLIADRCVQSSQVVDRKGRPVLIENDDGEHVPAFVFDAAGANRATELIARHLGMFKDGTNVNLSLNGVTFVVET